MKNYDKKISKGNVGYGTKIKALKDMKKDNIEFDELNDVFFNGDTNDSEFNIDIDLNEFI